MNSRQAILKRISAVRAAADIGMHPGNDFERVPMPPADVSAAEFDALSQFVELAALQFMSSEIIGERAQVPAAIKRYLYQQSLKVSACISPELQGCDINWLKVGFPVRMGNVLADGDTLVSECYAAVAEAGVLVVSASADHAAEADFLAETHIVLLRREQVQASFEDLWARWRQDFGVHWPRSMSLIAGPSCTADLGVPAKLGAHGPARVHVLIIDKAD